MRRLLAGLAAGTRPSGRPTRRGMKILVIAGGCVRPILLNTVEGMRAVDPVMTETALYYGIRGPARLRSLVLRSASLQIFAGLREAMSVGIVLRSSASALADRAAAVLPGEVVVDGGEVPLAEDGGGRLHQLRVLADVDGDRRLLGGPQDRRAVGRVASVRWFSIASPAARRFR